MIQNLENCKCVLTVELAISPGQELRYIGIGILGDKMPVNRFSGNLKLLR